MHNAAMLMSPNALVLREKDINTVGPAYIRLVGRKSGLLDWLLTLIGINTTTVFEVYENRIEYSHGSISGRIKETIPIRAISIVMNGYFRPIVLLILALLSLIGGIYMGVAGEEEGGLVGLGICFVLAIIFFVLYFLKKTTVIAVIPHSATLKAIAFKPSVIENKSISSENAQQICDIINALIDKANS